MNRYIKEVKELSLQDLLHYYVQHCISIVMVGVLFAGLVSGYISVKNRKIDNFNPVLTETEVSFEDGMLYDLNDQEQQQRNIVNYQMEKTALLNAVNNFQEQIQKQNAYFTNSVLMNMDPYHVVTSRVDLRVWVLEEGQIQQLSTLLLYYKQVLCNGKYLSDLADDLGMDQASLKELVLVTSGMADYIDDVLQGGISSDNEDLLAAHLAQGSYGHLSIIVKGIDAEWTEKVLGHILSYLYSLEKENLLGINQKLEEVDRFTTIGTDLEVRTSQMNSNVHYVNLFNQLNTINTTLNNLSKPIDVSVDSSATFSKKDLLKYMLFGGFAGVFLMLLLYGLKYLFDDSVSSYARISKDFNINHLGSFIAVDNTHRLAETTTLEMICANVRIYSDEKDRILLAGCANESMLDGIGKTLSDHFPDQHFIIGGNIAKNPDAREKLSDCDAVILLEERKVSKHSVIQHELEILEPLDIKLLGVIVA